MSVCVCRMWGAHVGMHLSDVVCARRGSHAASEPPPPPARPLQASVLVRAAGSDRGAGDVAALYMATRVGARTGAHAVGSVPRAAGVDAARVVRVMERLSCTP